MKVRWASTAIRDRLAIFEYVVDRNPRAAIALDLRFEASARQLSIHPEIGKEGRVFATREIPPHRNYLIVYEIHEDHVVILAVVHTKRQWPPTPISPAASSEDAGDVE